MWIESLLFYLFAGILIAASVMVISLRNPVRCALALVTAFIASAVLWLLLEREFLALILILVYVGAVMTLFLFVVMMLNLQKVEISETFVPYLPWAVLLVALMVGLLIFVVGPNQIGLSVFFPELRHLANYNNIASLGNVLYTEYFYPFELAAVLLLIAILAGISLAFRGHRSDSLRQDLDKQLQANAKDRVKLVRFNEPKEQG